MAMSSLSFPWVPVKYSGSYSGGFSPALKAMVSNTVLAVVPFILKSWRLGRGGLSSGADRRRFIRSSVSFLACSRGSQAAHFGRGFLSRLLHFQTLALDHLLGAYNLLLGRRGAGIQSVGLLEFQERFAQLPLGADF